METMTQEFTKKYIKQTALPKSANSCFLNYVKFNYYASN